MRAVVIGFGYWGPNLARNINESDELELVGILDIQEEPRKKASRRFPGVKILSSLDQLDSSVCDIVFISTPASTHFGIAKQMIEKALHVWIEKPATVEYLQTLELINLSNKHNKRIFVDHPFTYSPAVQEMKNLIYNGAIGRPLYFLSQRSNLGIFQPDVSVLHDLAVHDLSILKYCLPSEVHDWVSCSQGNPLNSGTDSIVNINITSKSGFVSNISCNWLSPVKIRNTTIIGTEAALVFNDNETIEKLKIFSQKITAPEPKAMDIGELMISYRSGEVASPHLSPIEPLRLAINDVGICLLKNKVSRNELFNQSSVMELLDLASQSASQFGNRIKVGSTDD